MSNSVAGSATGVEGSIENNETILPGTSLKLFSGHKNVNMSGLKRPREESQLCERLPCQSSPSPVRSGLKKLNSSPLNSFAVKPCITSHFQPKELKPAEKASESNSSEDKMDIRAEKSLMTARNSTSVTKPSSKCGCNLKDSLKHEASNSKLLEPCAAPLKKSSKRKHSLFQKTLDSVSRVSYVQQFQQDIDSLIKYFNGGFEDKILVNTAESVDGKSTNTKTFIANHLEESRLPFSKLVQQIYETLKDQPDQHGEEKTLSFVKSSVLLIGQRSFYGISKAETDVLEDESESSLWCWEVRDLKLLPKSRRDVIRIHRRCRKKIYERITALSAMITALSTSKDEESRGIDLVKAEEMLAKADDEMSIRATVADLLQKNDAQMSLKQAMLKDKKVTKERGCNDRISDKEQKRIDRELKREKILQEKEHARIHKEAIIQEKDLKRRQEEAEKEQKRREKEEAEMKKQLALQKQATIMDRFLHSKKTSPKGPQNGVTEGKGANNTLNENRQTLSAVIVMMDQILLQGCKEMQEENLLRLHLVAWHDIHDLASAKRPPCWGVRCKPKVSLFKELRLQSAQAAGEGSQQGPSLKNKGLISNAIEDVNEFKPNKLLNESDEQGLHDGPSYHDGNSNYLKDSRFQSKRRKLLQFDKSHRPAYYGTFSKKSGAVGPRHPFRKDSCLDYEIDSDEEWEEEDPGESISDCDKDEEEESIESEKEGEKYEEDDDNSEDGFLVPDGYLSENEGVRLDDIESDMDDDSLEDLPNEKVSQCCGKNQSFVMEDELNVYERRRKILESTTEQALRSNHTFVVSNFIGHKINLASGFEDAEPNTSEKLKQICLKALKIQVFSPDIYIELPFECPREENLQEEEKPGKRQQKSCMMLMDSDLPELVNAIQSHSQGMNKIIESLLKKFPTIAKKQLKNKVREIADFAGNHWRVKMEILERLGMASSAVQAPETPKGPPQHKGIETFFSKHYMPSRMVDVSGQLCHGSDNCEDLKSTIHDRNQDCKLH